MNIDRRSVDPDCLPTMSTYTQILYHIVYSTKHRRPCLGSEGRPELFAYTWGILKSKNCHLYRINGVEDHIHLLTEVHPSIALAGLIKDIKVASSVWIKRERRFPGFGGWQTGYAAFTHSIMERDRLVEYIRGQEEHHKRVTFKEELRRLLEEAGIEFNEEYFE